MAAADVYCQPNTAPEPFGVALVEALAAGTPVVTTGMGGALEIVDERCGIRVPAATARHVASALQRLIDDPALRARLGAGGRVQARRLSDPAARLQQLRDVLRTRGLGTSAA
jgi:glycosyltransferase involved in cell wall biosynthesis